MSIKISCQFDAGAIDVISTETPQNINLKLRKDCNADFSQWFYFRLQGAANENVRICIRNANQATYPDGWTNYRAVASYDRKNWFRVQTFFDGTNLWIDHAVEKNSIYFAYFEPYSWERHLNFVDQCEQSELVKLVDLGSSIQGRDINCLQIGNPSANKKVWMIARQHPGETMAEWFVEGFVESLLDPYNSIATEILKHACVYVVPNMNPDGSVLGNLRTNAAGANLNREWMTPSLEISPEVFHVKNKITETGCHLFLDIHGDEVIPYNFVAGSEMLEGFNAEDLANQEKFLLDYCNACPDFQTVHGYPASKYSTDLLKLASKYIGYHFKCISLTLEMPFKDNDNAPNPLVGWNGERSKRLGVAITHPILNALKRMV